MIREYDIEMVIVSLERARTFAVASGLGEHFINELDHLIATAKANKELQCQHQ